jgi:hypothetical protein
MHDIKQTLEFILQSISPNDIDKISVESHEENGLTILEIISTPEVTGQIIGKEGRIIKSIRTLLGAAYPNIRFNVTLRN